MEKILKKNISSLNNKAIYRIPSNDKYHVYDIGISDEIPDNYKTFIPNKFNNKNEYTTNKNSAPFALLDSQEFPEKDTCDECVLTNDGILAFRCNTDVIVYDLLHEDSKTFDEITNEVKQVNISQLKEIDKQSMLAYHYLLSFDNQGFLPVKISNNLFYMDCEEIDGYTKTDDGYFYSDTACPEHINTIKIKNKLIYNVKFYNGKTKDNLSDSNTFIENNVINGGTGESTELTLKSNSTDTIVIELW